MNSIFAFFATRVVAPLMIRWILKGKYRRIVNLVFAVSPLIGKIVRSRLSRLRIKI